MAAISKISYVHVSAVSHGGMDEKIMHDGHWPVSFLKYFLLQLYCNTVHKRHAYSRIIIKEGDKLKFNVKIAR